MKVIRRRTNASAIPLCSTADIAFLLLIFFMVLAKATNESTVDWKPAITPVPLNMMSNSAVTVIVDRQNSLFINGMPSSVAELKDSVGAYLGNKPRGQRQVLLKVDREVPARVFTQVMLELGEVSADIFRILEPPSAPLNR